MVRPGGCDVRVRGGIFRRSIGSALLIGALGESAALGQASTSVLTGDVTDASTKAPVSDVVVTATSPSLQGEQVVVTDATGLYRVPQLPPGTYALRFEKESYRPFLRTNIDVAADRTLRLNVQLLPETAGTETVTVIGAPPTIDVGSSTVGTLINQDFVRNLALSPPGGLGGANRSFDSVAAIAPQVNNDVYGVGINGATSPENQYLVDGLSVNDPAFGVLGSRLTIEFIDELNVITGGYMPEYGRTTGGTLSAITKSGGNEFHGSVWGTFAPGVLTGRSRQTGSAGATGTVIGKRDLYNIGDFGATIGGYIIKDQLWFFAGVAPAFQRYSYTRQFQSTSDGGETFTPIPKSQQRRFGDEHTVNYIGKLTYLINSDHRVSVQVTGTPTRGGGPSSFALRVPQGLQARAPVEADIFTAGTFNSSHVLTTDDSLNINGNLNSSFLAKRLLLDVRVGWHHQKDAGTAGDGSGIRTDGPAGTLAATPNARTDQVAPVNLTDVEDQLPATVKAACMVTGPNPPCPVTGWSYGGRGFIDQLTLDSVQAKGAITYLLTALGHHVFKAGVDMNFSQYESRSGYTGRVAYGVFSGPRILAATGQPVVWFDRFRLGYLSGLDQPVTVAFAQVKGQSTVIGGFVQDSWSILDKITVNLGIRYDTLALRGDDGVTRMALNDQISPRVGFVYDPTQQGRSKLYANYGRYFEQIPLEIANRELSITPGIAGFHNINCNPLGPNGVANCDGQTLIRSNSGPSRRWLVMNADQVPVDPNLKSAANDEIVAGADYELFPNARIGASYTYRNLVTTVEDMSNDEGSTYFIGNPGEGIADTFPKAKRTYHAFTLQFSKTFANLWLAQASYTYSTLRGNYDGLYVPESKQLEPNLNATFDLRSLLLNQYGPLSNDIAHTVKLYVAKEFVILPVLSVTTGAGLNANSGIPIDYLGAHEIYGPSQAYILERGSGGRLPWVTTFDAHIGLNFRFTKDLVLTAFVDGFNLFNSQRPSSVDNNYTFDVVGPIINGMQGAIPGNVIGSVVVVTTNTDPNKGPVYDPNLSFAENVKRGAAAVITAGNGSLPRPEYVNGSPKQVLLPDPAQNPTPVTTNPNWGRPTEFQAARIFRFGVRVTF
jgi:Carboxypeptidase regulatory-like domain/TonB dependent receptor